MSRYLLPLLFIFQFFCVSLNASECLALFPRYIEKTSELFKASHNDFYYTQLKDSGLSEQNIRLEVLHQLIRPEAAFYDHVRVRVTSSNYQMQKSFEGLVDVLLLALDGSMMVKSYPIHVVEGRVLNKSNVLSFLDKQFKSQYHILDLKDLLNSAYKNKEFLRSVIQDVSKHHSWGALNLSHVSHKSLKDYRLKNYYRLKEKVFTRALDKMMAKLQRSTTVSLYRIEMVDDLLAARIVVKSSSPLLDKHFVKKNLTKLLKKHKAQIVEIEKKGVDDFKASGYSAIHVTIANQHNRHEIQIMTEAMSIWHRWEHEIYKTKHQYNEQYRKALESYSRELAGLVGTLEKQITQKKLFFKTRNKGITAETFYRLNEHYQSHFRIHPEHIFNKDFIAEILQAR